MYEGLIETIKTHIFGENEEKHKNHMSGEKNILTDGCIKLVSKGNITFEGTYTNAQILEKKKAFLPNA